MTVYRRFAITYVDYLRLDHMVLKKTFLTVQTTVPLRIVLLLVLTYNSIINYTWFFFTFNPRHVAQNNLKAQYYSIKIKI